MTSPKAAQPLDLDAIQERADLASWARVFGIGVPQRLKRADSEEWSRRVTALFLASEDALSLVSELRAERAAKQLALGEVAKLRELLRGLVKACVDLEATIHSDPVMSGALVGLHISPVRGAEPLRRLKVRLSDRSLLAALSPPEPIAPESRK